MAAASLRAHGGQPVVTRADLMEASRHQLQHDLKSLAVRVDKTYRWEDLVISVDGYHALIEMISYAKNAERVYDDWGFGAKHSVAGGISALFSGPPGTGKTMCAGVIARELDMELFRVDLSRVVSKWIGETEKNLARVFDEAQRSNAVVLFDEADSLFAKRTEVKSSVDRYANLEVNFLLQRMETFNGITVLTTNFEDTIDSAFKRRLTFRIRFEKPDADARGALWEKMFPPTAQLADDVDFARARAPLRGVGRQHPQRRHPRRLPRGQRGSRHRSGHARARDLARGARDGRAHRRRAAAGAEHLRRRARRGSGQRRRRSRDLGDERAAAAARSVVAVAAPGADHAPPKIVGNFWSRRTCWGADGR